MPRTPAAADFLVAVAAEGTLKTTAEVKEMNLQQFHNLKSQGKTAITIYGQHKPSPQNKSIPTKEEFDILLTQTTSKNPKNLNFVLVPLLCY